MPPSAGFPASAAPSPQHVGPVRVALVAECDRAALLKLRVRPAQRPYVGLIEDMLAHDHDLRCRDGESMAILHADTPIGYYRIEPRVRVVTGHDLDPPALGLRAFFIDWRWQRHGFGTLAMQALLADLAIRHPWAAQVALMVNCSNHAALALYRRVGFAGSAELYHGGRTGPMWLLTRPLSGRSNLS